MHLFLSPSNIFSSLITFIFLICTIPSVYATDERHRNCSLKFDCANQRYLGYPFWTQGRAEYCGHPDFKLNCNGESPEMIISSVHYKILNIHESSHTLRLARTDYADTLCPTNPINSTFSPTLFGIYPDTHLITLYYDCPDLHINYTKYAGDSDCEGDDRRVYYVTRDLSSPLLAALKSFISAATGGCRTNVLVPMSDSAIKKVEQSQGNLGSAIHEGFELRWNASDSACDDCENSGGACGYDPGSGGFICYCADQPHSLTCNSTKKGSSGRKHLWLIVISMAAAGVTFTSLGCTCLFIYRPRQKSKLGKGQKTRKSNWDNRSIEVLVTLKRYNYAKVKKMTNSFTHIVGNGGFGTVYRGKLPDGRLVAVKMLNESKSNGEEFINEVGSLSKTSHVNIVSLLGFCYERTKRAIIYEFVTNGSLEKFILNQDSSKRDWKTLYDIALGIARGLEYLHKGCSTRIVHFDIKPQNILLDEDLCPKISDFGLAKLCGKKQSILSLLDARGTFGYIAPEVFSKNYGRVSHKSDVYSYGMLVLEMVGARMKDAGEPSASNSSSAYFPDWIYKDLERWENARILGDEITEGGEKITRKMIMVGLWCIQSSPLDRPPMSKVVEMMEGSLEALQIPPKPLLFCQAASLLESPWPAEKSSSSTEEILG